jgi:hypothetical protein
MRAVKPKYTKTWLDNLFFVIRKKNLGVYVTTAAMGRQTYLLLENI